MKIQLGAITINKTKKYLMPCLKAYGKNFEERINAMFKIGVGVGDMILLQSGIRYEKHIFILVDTSVHINHLRDSLEWLRDQPMYEDDYAYDGIHSGNLLMIVIKLPEKCYKAREWFMHSQFSKMYTMSDIERYFRDQDVRGVLIKDHNYKIKYAKVLNSIHGTTLTDEDAAEIEGELDFPIRQEDETFGTDLVNQNI